MTDAEREAAVLDRVETFRRRRPRFTDEIITLAHGAGGKASATLIDAVFADAFSNDALAPLADGACLELPSGERLVFSTDSFVVKPLRFPGGSIGDLAVNGTVNDLAVMGARPLALSAAFVLEEGFAVADLRAIVADMAAAADTAGVRIVTGDTKVVNRGAADGAYITTAGVGLVPAGRELGPERVRPGDHVLVSGTIADHGMAVMLARGDLAIDADLRSDTAALNHVADVLFDAAPSTRWMRDPTRGGLGTVCNELARAANVAVLLDESSIPVDPAVNGACDLLGIDPVYVANEGKLVAVVAPEESDAALAALRGHPLGAAATRIGEIRDDPPGIVVLLTSFGGTRIVDMLVGDPLPPHLLMLVRRQVRVTGIVQGVGFRPFVYREAVALQLAGYVRNDSAGVLIEVEGSPDRVAELCRRLVESAPPLARVERVEETPLPTTRADRSFAILHSDGGGPPDVPVSVDSATCPECLAEVDDPTDRRFGYPFTNCTNCGPRYTIVESVPYDRPATTMASFVMCDACRREYDDPGDRRFHAQPNACPRCGPQLRWSAGDGSPPAEGTAAMDAAVDALRAGAVLAIKGLGGYHLAVDATDDVAVTRLRERKRRDDKPFAVMVADVATARRLVELDAAGEAALSSLRRPIVLGAHVTDAPISAAVAPGLTEVGVMLPYTPLHHLLLGRLARPLVMTSGNLSDEPIAHLDDDAGRRLGPLVDGILAHDRPIHIRCDDSVVRAARGGTQVLRRSRGYAPEPIGLPFLAEHQVLAVGAELKNTIAVAKGGSVVASHHIGDLEHLPAYQSFLQATTHLCRLYGVAPDVVAHDMHPEYLSTKFAADLDLPTLAVQHHHAHVASCLVDNGRTGPVIGVAFDGHGYGPDGTLWGGELLLADLDGFERVGHLLAVPLPGGTAAIREPWRMAVAWVAQAGEPGLAGAIGARFDDRSGALLGLLDAPATLRTSSVGRLFDAIAALVCGRARVSYEGQAAIELEAMAAAVPLEASARYPVEQRWEDGQLIMDPTTLVARLAGADPGPKAAAAFHQSLGLATVDAVVTLARRRRVEAVALTGGVFQNARLSRIVDTGLREAGLEVLLHRTVPPNDGGISIGQAAIAAHQGNMTVAPDGHVPHV